MRLKSLKIYAREPNGWESDHLKFAVDMTQLFGPNSCGKTPVIQSVAYALGYQVKFRDDILKNCASVELTLTGDDGDIQLLRQIGGRFDVRVSKHQREPEPFYNEKDYSAQLFQIFDIKTTTLTSTNNEPVEPYVSTFLPLFYLDQDHGYTSVYHPPASFIKDQYGEMMRLALGLSAKNSFERQKLKLEKKKRLRELHRLVVSGAEAIEELRGEFDAPPRKIAEINEELERHTESLQLLRESRTAGSDAYRALAQLINDKKTAAASLAKEIRELKSRISGFAKIQGEIETEIRTLSLNTAARRLFTSFEEICRNPDCGLFLSSSESYGKSLLYLRDQTKDLKRNTSLLEIRMAELETARAGLEVEIAKNEQQLAESAGEDEVSGLVDAVRELHERVYDLQSESRRVSHLNDQESEYLQNVNERERIQDELASLSNGAGQSDLQALEIRGQLRHQMRRWLDVLDTKNVSRDIEMDSDFVATFGGEKVSQIHGSTLTRVVLATHAAFFETYLRDPNRQLRFMILDTPRQQDIEAAALADYISEIKNLVSTSNAQVIFSTTEYHYVKQKGDEDWRPTFPAAEQNMFLGSRGKD